ncbi:hypothetical protein HPG69_016203 [Diceros bicornis minor]|uniref:Uncharacterized protein n=1 Tax=Diceros bicornis minor TaxID=77932 RepID=A0A7J7FIR6_DICBM|nr:hypothetical protein HPG69_016203 [Diceros bicornis minor]
MCSDPIKEIAVFLSHLVVPVPAILHLVDNNYNCWSLGSYRHAPVTLSTTLYSTSVNCGDAVCLLSQNRMGLLETSQRHAVKLPATNHPAVCPQPVKFLATLPLLTVSPGLAEQPVVFPSFLTSPVPVNQQCIIDLRTICPLVATPRTTTLRVVSHRTHLLWVSTTEFCIQHLPSFEISIL